MNNSFQIGLKLYSINVDQIEEAEKLFERGFFDYIELYAIPGSYKKYAPLWKRLAVPFVVHAAHFMHGINFAHADWRRQNRKNFSDAQLFADNLKSDVIIIHAGNGGPIEEAISQIRALHDDRIAIENKPKLGLNGNVCVGWSPQEFKKFRNAGLLNRMVLDFVHAVCAAISEKKEPLEWIEQFLTFNPDLFHIVDGDGISETDHHLNLGKGNLPLGRFLEKIPLNGRVTLETPRDPGKGLKDFLEDVRFLRNYKTGSAL
jgi:sugar phosphate isomerase/epimerase